MAMSLNGNAMGQMSSPALSNTISSLGAAQEIPAQEPTPTQTQATDLVNRFGKLMQDLENLSASFPTTGQEFYEVQKALQNWLAAASDNIATSGRESATY